MDPREWLVIGFFGIWGVIAVGILLAVGYLWWSDRQPEAAAEATGRRFRRSRLR